MTAKKPVAKKAEKKPVAKKAEKKPVAKKAEPEAPAPEAKPVAKKAEPEAPAPEAKPVEAATPEAKPVEAPALVDRSVKSESGRAILYPGAPKACFGRKYGAESTACEGAKGKNPRCAHADACKALLAARAQAGVTGPDDLRIPGDWPVPEVASKDLVPVPPPAAPPADVLDGLHPAETTIPNDALDEAAKRIAEIEGRAVVAAVDVYYQLGVEYRAVARRMARHEFSAWVLRLGRGVQTVRGYVRLAEGIDAQANIRERLLGAPGITLGKLETLLTAGESLAGLLECKVLDKHGEERALIDLPTGEIKGAIVQHKAREAAGPSADAAASRAAKADAARKAGSKPPVETTPPRIAPVLPGPYLRELLAVKRNWARVHEAIEGNNLAALNDRDIAVLHDHVTFLEGLLRDLRVILKVQGGAK
jgi:hypothetical protein